MSDMTYGELRCALEVATENRRVLAQAVLDCERLIFGYDHAAYDEAHLRMLSLAQELVK